MAPHGEDTGGLLITNSRIITSQGELHPGWLLTEGRVIRQFGAGNLPEFEPGQVARRVDAGGQTLLPGFIDLHVHGAVGHDTMDASPEGLREMARFYARHGVIAFLATTWTASRQEITTALQAITRTCGPQPGGATLLGAHLEGPYLNPAKCGAQDTRHIRRADPGEAREFLDSGCVRLVALAPEFPENLWLIEECIRRGVTVAAGHTIASYDEMRQAVSRGLSQVTHCFNGMGGFDHRTPGTVGAALALAEIRCELIADNIHVHPAAQKVLMEAKGPQGVVLITDAIRGAGLPDGEFPMGDRQVTIHSGEVRLPDGSLAGSVLTMERALRNACHSSGRTLAEAWAMSSLNAACAIGIDQHKGSLQPGKDADLVLLDGAFQVTLTIAEGQVVYEQGHNSE